jgi:branched-chain amino acid transport system ATP-binding protein
MTGPLLAIRNLEVRYGDLIGVSDVSLEVPEGSVVALLGSNGGGKTTVLNAIAGQSPVHAGLSRCRGEEIGGQQAFSFVRKGLALSPEGWRLFVQQSVENNLLLGATPLRDKARAAVLLERVGMSKLADAPARSLGTPGRKRLEIARALATEPKVLLLDEAMAGLTQSEVRLAIDLVRDIHRSGITLVIVEHIMEVIMSLASRVVVFHQGKEIARGSPREVTANPAVIAAYLGTRAAKAAAGHTPVELMGGPAT